jgi:hypothetical protein
MSPRWLLSGILLMLGAPASAAPRLAPAKLEGQAIADLPAPYNLQTVVLSRNVTLNWAWDPPDPGPQFLSFGYEVMRDGELIKIVPVTAYSDFGLDIGTHTYQVRVKGGSKEAGTKYTHYSAWSEPADVAIRLTCAGAPVIHLTVEPTKRQYGSIPALRLHFKGQVKVPEGCHADQVVFHIDSGLSTERSGPLTTASDGTFDEFIDAMGPEEEPISGDATFRITVTAKDEAGGSSSGVFAIDLQKEDRYAPKQP